MPPQAALASEVFRFYVSLVVGFLVVAGAVLAALRRGVGQGVQHAWQSYRGWLIMVPVVLVSLFLGRVVVIVFFTLVALAGCTEYARATGLYRDWGMTGAVYLGIVAVGILALIPDPTTGLPA